MRGGSWWGGLLVMLGGCAVPGPQGTPLVEEPAERPSAPAVHTPPLPAPAAESRAAQAAGPPVRSQTPVRSQGAQGPDAVVGAPSLLPPLPVFDAALSTSIGLPSDGRLESPFQLPLTGPGFRANERRDLGARFASGEVLNAITSAARVVAEAFPGSELIVNDLSREGGGPIAHHGSHRAGRDADILFYLRADDGTMTRSVGAPIDPQGIGYDYGDLALAEDDVRVHFDAERTWRFVAALLEDRGASVQRIFVAEHLRQRLLEAADAEQPSRPQARARFAEITCQPSYPHDDHLHVRWFCSAQDIAAGCRDLPPLYPWHVDELARQGVAARLGRPRKDRPRSEVVTFEKQARRNAQRVIHPDVRAFLRRRKAWSAAPHPGREYCP